MAENEKGDEEGDNDAQSSISSWWGTFYDSAKQKLAETNDFLVRDMKEFTDTVKSDTSKLVASTAASMKDQLNIKVNLDEASNATRVVTNSISGFLGKVVQHVTPIPPDEGENDDSTMFLGTSSGVKIMTPAEARLFSLQTSPATYCNEPDNIAEFDLWRESFHLDAKKEELSLLMLDSKEVRSLYTKLVPEAVSHVDFWTRYFYKKHGLEKAEERRAKLVERAEAADPSLAWDDEDDFDVVDAEDASPAAPGNSRASTDPIHHVTTEQTTETKIEPIIAPVTETNQSEVPVHHVTSTPETHHVTLSNDHVIERCADSDPSETKLTSVNVPKPTTPPPSEPTKPVFDDSSRPEAEVAPSSASTETGPSTELKEPSTSKPATSPPTQADSSTVDSKRNSSPKVAESSSGADSSDWEKEFDLDMTEDEIIEALQEEDDEGDIEGWEEWQ